MKGWVRKALTSFSDQHIELLIRMYYVRKAIIFICRIVLFSEFLLETHEARTFKIKWDCHIETISGLMEVERTKKRRLITFRTMMATHRFWPLRHIRRAVALLSKAIKRRGTSVAAAPPHPTDSQSAHGRTPQSPRWIRSVWSTRHRCGLYSLFHWSSFSTSKSTDSESKSGTEDGAQNFANKSKCERARGK